MSVVAPGRTAIDAGQVLALNRKFFVFGAALPHAAEMGCAERIFFRRCAQPGNGSWPLIARTCLFQQ